MKKATNMKLAKRTIKWSMLVMPIVLFVIALITSSNDNAFDKGVAVVQTSVFYVMLCLVALGIIKLLEKMRRASEKTN